MMRAFSARAALLFLVPYLIFWICLDVQPLARAQSPAAEETGLKIAIEARERGQGYGNFTASQVMVLRNRQGQESRRQLRVKVLEVAGDGDKSMFVFDQPRDIQGTAAHPRP